MPDKEFAEVDFQFAYSGFARANARGERTEMNPWGC
jgi:hypothetical protein